MLKVNNLTVQYGSLTIVHDIGFCVEQNQWLMIVGPNGAGKSTIVNAICQSAPYTGTVLFDGVNISKYKPSALARKLGVLTQNHHVGYSFTVEEVVKLGRYSYSPGIFASSDDDDNQKIDEALALTGMEEFRTHSVLTLSGGELQRTFLAQIFAQDPKLLILDEPTNHLDLVYQKQVFKLIADWTKQEGRAVISVVHDLSLAKAYGTHALLLDRGKCAAFDDISNVLTREHLQSVYAMDVHQWMQDMLAQWQ